MWLLLFCAFPIRLLQKENIKIILILWFDHQRFVSFHLGVGEDVCGVSPVVCVRLCSRISPPKKGCFPGALHLCPATPVLVQDFFVRQNAKLLLG